jgi:hypothetical protein
VVQTASQNPDGSFTHGSAVGRAFGTFSPQLAITPAGEQVLVWRSGRSLRSAVRYSAGTEWKLQKIGAGSIPRLLMDHSGRAIVIWQTSDGAPTYTGSIWASTRLPRESWSPPSLLLAHANMAELSTAVDSDGDIVITYQAVPSYGPTAGTDKYVIWAITLPVGAAAWTAPQVISGSDVLSAGSPRVAGGGARTFVVTWRAANAPGTSPPPQPPDSLRAARLRLPGTWEAPQMVLPPLAANNGVAYATVATLGVDALGNALAILRYGVPDGGFGLDALLLGTSVAEWAAAVVLDYPQGASYLIDSPPALTFGEDGSASLTFLRMGPDGNSLRIATTQGRLDVWQGAQTDASHLASCPPGAIPGNDIGCPVWTGTTPAVAPGSVLTVAVQEPDATVVAFARAALDAPWSEPATLVPAGRTEASLRGGTARTGTVRIVATCALPPCRGVATLQMRDRPNAILGRVPFALTRVGSSSAEIPLPQWARKRAARGAGLWTRILFNVHEGDGTSEQTRLPFLLTGKSWIQARKGH